MQSTWLGQKLAQNGFTFDDLSQQTGISREDLLKLAETERGTSPEWDIVLSVLNDYPSIRFPAPDILGDLQNDLDTYPDGQALLYYGILDGSPVFCGYQNLSDGNYHGSATQKEYLSTLTTSLEDALTLFQRQNAASN